MPTRKSSGQPSVYWPPSGPRMKPRQFGCTSIYVKLTTFHLLWSWILEEIAKKGLPWRSVVKTLPSSAGGAGSIPGWGAKIPHASWPKYQNIKQKQYCNKFNKDFKNGPHQKNLKKKKKEIARKVGGVILPLNDVPVEKSHTELFIHLLCCVSRPNQIIAALLPRETVLKQHFNCTSNVWIHAVIL